MLDKIAKYFGITRLDQAYHHLDYRLKDLENKASTFQVNMQTIVETAEKITNLRKEVEGLQQQIRDIAGVENQHNINQLIYDRMLVIETAIAELRRVSMPINALDDEATEYVVEENEESLLQPGNWEATPWVEQKFTNDDSLAELEANFRTLSGLYHKQQMLLNNLNSYLVSLTVEVTNLKKIRSDQQSLINSLLEFKDYQLNHANSIFVTEAWLDKYATKEDIEIIKKSINELKLCSN